MTRMPDIEAEARAAVIALIDAADMTELVNAAKAYDCRWKRAGWNWTAVPDDQAARIIEGALLAFKSALAGTKET